jgi:hypothetical protein
MLPIIPPNPRHSQTIAQSVLFLTDIVPDIVARALAFCHKQGVSPHLLGSAVSSSCCLQVSCGLAETVAALQ